MSVNHASFFKDCYVMQRGDVERFADALADDGYLFAIATRLDKQGQNYGKPLINALLRYLDATGQGCYLETLKPENVGLYEHFSFRLMEQTAIRPCNLTMFAMYRPKSK